MFIGVFIFLILIVMGGLIAFLGDRIGSKVGKKRLTLFGLRPKYTSVIVTIISGVLISFTTIAALAVVNENVRVALFGLSKLQDEMKDLNQQIHTKNLELEKGKLELEARNKEYEDVTEKSAETSRQLEQVDSQRRYMESELSDVQRAYDEAKAGVEKSAEDIAELEKAREELTGNIDMLNQEKQQLIKNIYALREGQVVFQAGQVLTSVVVDEGMDQERTDNVLKSVLADINGMLKERLNITDDNVEMVRMSQKDFDEAVSEVVGSKNKKLVRVVAAQNLILGERLVVDFDIHDSLLVYRKGDVIFRGDLDKYKEIKNYEMQVLRFLRDLNLYAQSQGILPDPITGKVGVLDGQELMAVIQKVKDYNGDCDLIVKAARDIYTQGPLVIDVQVVRR